MIFKRFMEFHIIACISCSSFGNLFPNILQQAIKFYLQVTISSQMTENVFDIYFCN